MFRKSLAWASSGLVPTVTLGFLTRFVQFWTRARCSSSLSLSFLYSGIRDKDVREVQVQPKGVDEFGHLLVNDFLRFRVWVEIIAGPRARFRSVPAVGSPCSILVGELRCSPSCPVLARSFSLFPSVSVAMPWILMVVSAFASGRFVQRCPPARSFVPLPVRVLRGRAPGWPRVSPPVSRSCCGGAWRLRVPSHEGGCPCHHRCRMHS